MKACCRQHIVCNEQRKNLFAKVDVLAAKST